MRMTGALAISIPWSDTRSPDGGVCEELAAYLRWAQSWTLQLRAPGIERALPSAMVATGAMFVSVTWAGTSGPGLPQLAARTM